MKRQRTESAADDDRISNLPDEILHHILRRIKYPRDTARTCALSRRWRTLWRSYPVVEFDHEDRKRRRKMSGSALSATKFFEKFCNASIYRFRLDGLLRMEILQVSVGYECEISDLEKLLNFASERKAEEVAVAGHNNCGTVMHFRMLFGITAKILKLRNIKFDYYTLCNDDDLSRLAPNSVRFLHLEDTRLEDRILANLIVRSPLLETLKLKNIVGLTKKLKVSTHLTNLKTLEISKCPVGEIEISAPGLRTLRLEDINKFELTAPQLNLLEIEYCYGLTAADLDGVISQLKSLRSLTLRGLYFVKRLKFSSDKLERFELWPWNGLEEIDLDVGPSLVNLSMNCFVNANKELLDKLEKCQIGSSAGEIKFNASGRCSLPHSWFLSLKSFIARFPEVFDTVSISSGCSESDISFREEQVDYDVRPLAIKHLKIQVGEGASRAGQTALLDGLFWVCRPKFLTVIHDDDSGSCERLYESILVLTSCAFGERNDWQHRLKDIKIVKRNNIKDREVEEGELTSVSRSSLRELRNRKRACFVLTWS